MTCYSGFGNLTDGKHPVWIGDFDGDGQTDVLFYSSSDDNWWLGTSIGDGINWSLIGNTVGFGHRINDGRPFWTGRFSRTDRDEILFYYPGDGNWWLGTVDNGQLNWTFAGNTSGYQPPALPLHPDCRAIANEINNLKVERASLQEDLRHAAPGEKAAIVAQIKVINKKIAERDHDFQVCLAAHPRQQPPAYPNFGNLADGRPIWIGDFDGSGRHDVLFYYPGDDNWWLGTFSGTQLTWGLVGNTVGFGHGINDGRPFWTGRFSRTDRDEVLFYYPGDDNWWLGTIDNGQLNWVLVGNTAGFGHGINDGRPIWIGDFDGSGRHDVLFYYPGDDNWWLGTFSGTQLTWGLVGNTVGFGHGINDGRPFWTGRFSRTDRDEVLFYYPGDDNWWLGTIDNGQLNWVLAGNTAGFGHGINDGRPFWIGDFDGSGRHDVLFYYPGDGNWWLGTFINTQLQWGSVGNTGRPCSQSVVVHFKSLLQIDNAINTFIDTQFLAMHDLFSTGGVAVYRGTTEDLSGNAALQSLHDLNVGDCLRGRPTADQDSLYQNRNNVGNDELVVYVVQTLTGGAGNFVGCATHPDGQPGAAVVQSNARWLVAHEIGHVLDLRHVDDSVSTNSDFLMWPNTGWTNAPPDIAQSEFTTMLGSTLTRNC